MGHDSSANPTVMFITGAAIGAVVGAGVSLLTAPQSGEETRAMLRERADEEFSRAQVEAESTLNDLRRQADHIIADVQGTLDKARGQLAEPVHLTDEHAE